MIETSARPAALIEATTPPELRGIERDGVRMLVTDRARSLHSHATFFDLPSLLRPGDVLVVNDSATLPAALRAVRATGEALPVHVSTKIDSRICMVEPRASVLVGEELRLRAGGSVVLIAPVEPEKPRLWYAWFQLPLPMNDYLAAFGEPIRYNHANERLSLHYYQTMFARDAGSSEMPSAARPFTPRVVESLDRRGVSLATITLHCGVSSFEAPERPSAERYLVPHAAAAIVNRARHEKRRIVAVGTTVLRALESAVQEEEVVAASGWTDLIIDGHYVPRVVDGLLTGFHEASATHLWALQAFVSPAIIACAYAEAAKEAYYYHEFGDVHLIL